MPIEIICKKCGRMGVHGGYGLCKLCYGRELKKLKIICKGCNQEKQRYTTTLCKRCYHKSIEKKGICEECKEYKIITSKNLCRTCYSKRYPRNRIIKCKLCGENKINKAYGFCEKCYDLIRYNSETRNEWVHKYWDSQKESLWEKAKKGRENKLTALGGKCSRCGFDNLDALQIHHNKMRAIYGENNDVVILCANCHVIESIKQMREFFRGKRRDKRKMVKSGNKEYSRELIESLARTIFNKNPEIEIYRKDYSNLEELNTEYNMKSPKKVLNIQESKV
jgi:hypothetical protein